jgi:hypothetical protein
MSTRNATKATNLNRGRRPGGSSAWIRHAHGHDAAPHLTISSSCSRFGPGNCAGGPPFLACFAARIRSATSGRRSSSCGGVTVPMYSIAARKRSDRPSLWTAATGCLDDDNDHVVADYGRVRGGVKLSTRSAGLSHALHARTKAGIEPETLFEPLANKVNSRESG